MLSKLKVDSDKLIILSLIAIAIGTILMIVDCSNFNYSKEVLDSQLFIVGNNLVGLGIISMLFLTVYKLFKKEYVRKFHLFVAFVVGIVVPYSLYATIANKYV